MIEHLKISEQEYRGVLLPSYSLLKAIDNSGPRTIIRREEPDSESIDFGNLVDCLLLQPQELKNKFYFTAVEKPTNQLLTLADALVNALIENNVIFERNIAIDYCMDLIKDLNIFGNTKDPEKLLGKYDLPLFWNYVEVALESRGLTVFTPAILEEASEAIAILRKHPKSAYILETVDGEEDIYQLILAGDIDGKEVKVMLDIVKFDHKNKTITPYDLKCTEFRQKSFPYNFFKQKYYLQASLYLHVLVQWAKEKYPEYTVREFRFLVWSRSDKYPFVWVVSDSLHNDGFHGFTDYKGSKVKGVKTLLEDYYYYQQSGDYSIETEFIENDELLIL